MFERRNGRNRTVGDDKVFHLAFWTWGQTRQRQIQDKPEMSSHSSPILFSTGEISLEVQLL
jgi:hypothetical protein